MNPISVVLCIKTKILNDTIKELTSNFNTIHIIKEFYDEISCIERINDLFPIVFIMELDNCRINVKEIAGFLKNIPFVVGISTDLQDIIDYSDSQFFDIWIKERIDLVYFCKKINKITSIINSIQQEGYNNSTAGEASLFYSTPASSDHLFVKYNNESHRINFEDILFVYNKGNVLEINTVHKKPYYKKTTLKKFQEHLPKSMFVRISNSTIVNCTKIEHYRRDGVIIKKEHHKVTRVYQDNLKKILAVK